MAVTDSETLFSPTVPSNRLHPSFMRVATEDRYTGARRLMNQEFGLWRAADEQFIREFQTNGFDARVWELYLAATLRSLGFSLLTSGDRPDFHCLREPVEFFIEATTANPSCNNGAGPTISVKPKWTAGSDNRDEVAVRFGSILRSKAGKRYHELPHVRCKPLVFAVQAFFDSTALFHNSLPLVRYLYNLDLTLQHPDGSVTLSDAAALRHVGDRKTIDSGWFKRNSAVSAIIWSNSGTVQKFNRRAAIGQMGDPNWELHRHGTELDPTPGATDRATFVERVGTVEEPWEEGLVVLHNPFALVPLHMQAMDRATQVRVLDGKLTFSFVGRSIFSQSTAAELVSHRDAVVSRLHNGLSADKKVNAQQKIG